jgi:1,4-alpha-glucan branching enzyme
MAICILFSINTNAQTPVLVTSPGFLSEVNATTVTLTIDGTRGNGGLNGYTPVTDIYLHIGVITNLSTGPNDWKHVLTTWPGTAAAFNATSIGSSKWTFTLPANLRTYFGVTSPTEKIVRIAFLFRNGTGTSVLRNSNSSDMYIPVDTTGNLQVKFTAPPTEPRYTPWAEPVNVSIGQVLPVSAVTSDSANITLTLNGVSIGNVSNLKNITANPTINQGCNNTLKVIATKGSTTVTDSLQFFVNSTTSSFLPTPVGTKDGINYNAGDTSVTLVLYAPGKSSVAVLGSFNNWVASCNYIMNRTPDSMRHWITINGLTAGTVNKFQYLVDGIITTTDPYCELVLDPSDGGISAATYPGMPIYPTGQSGIVGTFTTGQTPFAWTTTSYTRPDQKSMIIYEMHMRDFLATHDWKTMKDTLAYLKNLGINCIEIMPFTEFDGNNSWGYNPDFYFAPDKYYGSATSLKQFIDAAHNAGIAVVLDAVFNQCTGQSPLAQLYWNSSTNKPSANSPYLNVDATHDYSVFNDFNHESQATKYYVQRFMKHWMQEYKLDGFRWDLAKGFTQTNTVGNISAWGNYDASRVNIWQQYYDSLKSYSPNPYCILEFFGSDGEEAVYANQGMMVWGKMNSEFSSLIKGYNGNLNRTYHMNHTGFTQPGLIAYAESHDEERLMYEAKINGNSTNTAHNVKTSTVALKRLQAIYSTFLSIPGPKMMWQFGELGYDYSINTCADGTTIASSCRLDPKPIKWNYYTDVNRKNVYNIVKAMNNLRNLKPNAFNGPTVTTGTDFGTNTYKKVVLVHTDLSLVAIANYDVNTQSSTVTFPAIGTWYNYLGTDSLNITSTSQTISLAAGDYKVYLNQKIASGINVVNAISTISNIQNLGVYPNPITNNSVLNFETTEDCNASISIIDITGKTLSIVYEGKIKSGENNFELKNNTQHLSAGIYYCLINSNKGNKTIKVIIE